MDRKKKILAIVGSATENSSNHRLVKYLMKTSSEDFEWMTIGDLKDLPHFNPIRTDENTPASVVKLRSMISEADAVVICTPEYIFGIPSGLKNALEWCVSTTVFSKKIVGLITASANGKMASDELTLIMTTLGATVSEQTTLLVEGVRGKFSGEGELIDELIKHRLRNFVVALHHQLLDQS
jgi:chromate reductase, NAD(P)H dehydrogenase (quinone)